jgi:hypothetical protein
MINNDIYIKMHKEILCVFNIKISFSNIHKMELYIKIYKVLSILSSLI